MLASLITRLLHMFHKAPKPSSIAGRGFPNATKLGAKPGTRSNQLLQKQSSVILGISAPKDSTISLQQGMDEGTQELSFDHILAGANEESRADDISRKVKMEDLSDILKDTRSAFFTLDSPTDESEEEEDAEKDKDTEDTLKEQLEQAKAKVTSMKARPSYPDINQLTELLVTSLKPELSKLLASHDFASCLPTELKELPSKITEISREIKELKYHVRDMEIELPGDLLEIPTKLETFTSTISSLSS
ncbi:hypothetical protein Tco_0712674 [Tanacetum coccineum]